eukprot:526581-Pelagomonas_calceolata.AAC.3
MARSGRKPERSMLYPENSARFNSTQGISVCSALILILFPCAGKHQYQGYQANFGVLRNMRTTSTSFNFHHQDQAWATVGNPPDPLRLLSFVSPSEGDTRCLGPSTGLLKASSLKVRKGNVCCGSGEVRFALVDFKLKQTLLKFAPGLFGSSGSQEGIQAGQAHVSAASISCLSLSA